MRKIIENLIQKPRIADIIVGLVIVMGVLTLLNLRSNFLPKEPVSFIRIDVVYRGASPQELEVDVVNKIEDKLKGLRGVKRITSSSKESFATVRVEIIDGANDNEVLLDVTNAVSQINSFPTFVETPVVAKEEITNYTMTIAIKGAENLFDLKDYAKKIKDELMLSPQLSQIFLFGFPEEEIEISVRERDLRTYNLTFDDIQQAIALQNIKASGGEIKTGKQTILIRIDNRSEFAKGFENISIKALSDGKIVRLQDVATIQNRFADKPEKSFVNGEQAVVMKVFSRSEEDILNNSSYIRQYINLFNDKNDKVKVEIVEDRSVALEDAIGTLRNNAWQGMLLVLVVLGLFLHHRIAFWVAFKIPVALLGMFIISSFYDLTINQVSLFGIIVVLGVIVDDGVVVAENIFQKFTDGASALSAAIEGTIEVIPAIVASLTTTAIAFSLFFFLDGQLGDYFSDIAFVVCATLFVALLETIFILPVHMARSKALTIGDKPWLVTKKANQLLFFVRDKVYNKLVIKTLAFPLIAIAGVLAIMIFTIFNIQSGVIKSTFFPTLDQDVITAKIELPLGTDEKITNQKLEIIEEAIWKVNKKFSEGRPDSLPVVNFTERIIGPDSDKGEVNIYLMEGDKRGILSFDIADAIRKEVGPIQEATNLSYGSIAIFGKPVSVALIGDNYEELKAAKKDLRTYFENRPDLKDVTDTDKEGLPELEMKLTSYAKYLGLSEAQVFDQIRKGFFGLQVQSLQRKDEEVKVWVRYDESDRFSLTQLGNARLLTFDGKSYPLSQIAEFHKKEGIREINHQNGMREIRVEADVKDLLTSVPMVLAETEGTILTSLKERFPNMNYSLEGEARLSKETQDSSSLPGIVVLIIIIFIIYINYKSLLKTLSILSLLPFAFVGVAWGSYIHNVPVSIFSFLGMVALWGILINNGLVLLSTYNEYIRTGTSFKDAIINAAVSRFRPIILTTITTVSGLAPLLLNNSLSAQFLKPTAIAIAYGLIFGTILTLIFLPAVLATLYYVKMLFHKYILNRKAVTLASLDIEIKEMKAKLS